MSQIVTEGLMDPQYSQRCQEYQAYIDEHINNVKLAFNKLFRNPEKPFTNFHGITGEKLEKLVSRLEMAVELHDSSKYLDEEFEGYRAKHYPTDLEKERAAEDEFYAKLIDANYETAWFNHFITNDHHPLHWKWISVVEQRQKVPVMDEDGNPLPAKEQITKREVKLKTPLAEARKMTPLAILHMICDWEAMSIKFNQSTVKWYIESATDEKKDMHPETRKIVEELLTQLYGEEIPPAGAAGSESGN